MKDVAMSLELLYPIEAIEETVFGGYGESLQRSPAGYTASRFHG